MHTNNKNEDNKDEKRRPWEEQRADSSSRLRLRIEGGDHSLLDGGRSIGIFVGNSQYGNVAMLLPSTLVVFLRSAGS